MDPSKWILVLFGLFIVLHELLPAAHRYMNNPSKTTAWLIAGMVIMSLSLVLFVQ